MSNQLMQNILNTPTPEGTAALWWLGQMGYLIKMGDTVLCIDYFAAPMENRQTPPAIPMEEVEGVTAFLGTHDHLDHIDHVAWKVWGKTCPQAKFICSKAHTQTVQEDGITAENVLGINEGESIQIGDVTIHAIAAAHEFLDRDPETGVYPHLQYIIEGNGVKIHHAGDTLRYEGMLGKIRAFGRLDAELLPINGRDAVRYRGNCIGNMTYQEAVDLAGETETRMVVPGHWDMFKDNSADPEAFADYLDAKYQDKVVCHIPKVMDMFIVKAAQEGEKA